MSDLTSIHSSITWWSRFKGWFSSVNTWLKLAFVPQPLKEVTDNDRLMMQVNQSWFDKTCAFWAEQSHVLRIAAPLLVTLLSTCIGVIVGFPVLFALTAFLLSLSSYVGLTLHHNKRVEGIKCIIEKNKDLIQTQHNLDEALSEVKHTVKDLVSKNSSAFLKSHNQIISNAKSMHNVNKQITNQTNSLHEETKLLTDKQKQITCAMSDTATSMEIFNSSLKIVNSEQKKLQVAQNGFVKAVKKVTFSEELHTKSVQKLSDLADKHEQVTKEQNVKNAVTSDEIQKEIQDIDKLISKQKELLSSVLKREKTQELPTVLIPKNDLAFEEKNPNDELKKIHSKRLSEIDDYLKAEHTKSEGRKHFLQKEALLLKETNLPADSQTSINSNDTDNSSFLTAFSLFKSEIDDVSLKNPNPPLNVSLITSL